MSTDENGDEGAINPNSRYDQSFNFSESDSEGIDEPLDVGFAHNNKLFEPNPGEYSPRPTDNPDMDGITQFSSIGNLGAPKQPTGFDLNLGQRAPYDPTRFSSSFSPRPEVDTNPAVNAPELAQIFSLISKFQPPDYEMPPHFKPFVPDLIPSIGAIDAFIKVPRPDGEQDPLGLTVVDEPTIGCSSPQILKMRLREEFGVVGGNEGDGYIGFIEQPHKNYKALQAFLESYDEVQTNRAAPTMSYSYKMPDLEDLMQVWPDELEKALESLPLPTADLDLSLVEYAQVVCALLDIPVKGNIVESLHVLFSLYQEFKSNLFFQTKAPGKDGVDSLDI